PAIWGFTLSPAMIFAYAAATAALAAARAIHAGWRAAIVVFIAALLLFYGFVGFPWPAFIVIVGLAAYYAGGFRIAAFASGGLGFVLVTGLWLPLMQSLYLTALAVFLCLAFGGAL